MNNDTFEQIEVDLEKFGDHRQFLKARRFLLLVRFLKFHGPIVAQDNVDASVRTYNGQIVICELPIKVAYKVVEADPVVKGLSINDTSRYVTLENGYKAKVSAVSALPLCGGEVWGNAFSGTSSRRPRRDCCDQHSRRRIRGKGCVVTILQELQVDACPAI